MAWTKLIFLLVCILVMTWAFPQLAFPHLPDEEVAHSVEENKQSSNDWFENLRYFRKTPHKHQTNPHPPHHPHIGNVHPENIHPQIIGSDQIEYKKSDSPMELRRFVRQVILIPTNLAEKMDEGEGDDRGTTYVSQDLYPSGQRIIKEVFKRDQVVVESSLYEKGHEPQVNAQVDKGNA